MVPFIIMEGSKKKRKWDQGGDTFNANPSIRDAFKKRKKFNILTRKTPPGNICYIFFEGVPLSHNRSLQDLCYSTNEEDKNLHEKEILEILKKISISEP